MNTSRHLATLLDSSSLTTNTNITILRDSTQSGDTIPLLQHLTRTLKTSYHFPKHRIIYLSTRTRSVFISKTNIYPIISRVQVAALSACTPIDPYSIVGLSRGHHAALKILEALRDALKDRGVVIVECLHAIKYVFGINPAAFIRSISGLNGDVSIIVAAPTTCGLDEEITSLVHISDTVLDLTDLQTGFAIDIDGMIRIARQKGRWMINSTARRYKITESGFNIYT